MVRFFIASRKCTLEEIQSSILALTRIFSLKSKIHNTYVLKNGKNQKQKIKNIKAKGQDDL